MLHTVRRVDGSRSDLALEFLPLCHVLERMVSYCYMWYSTSKDYCSVVHVCDLIGSIRPTIFTGVPRFYEKVQQKILDAVAAAPPVKRALFDSALGVGREAALRRIAGGELSGTLGARHRLADRLVLSKGHSVPVVYAALAHKGFFDRKILRSYREKGSILQGHPDCLKTPGLDTSSGSLGQGLSLALGMALGARQNNQGYIVKNYRSKSSNYKLGKPPALPGWQ